MCQTTAERAEQQVAALLQAETDAKQRSERMAVDIKLRRAQAVAYEKKREVRGAWRWVVRYLQVGEGTWLT